MKLYFYDTTLFFFLYTCTASRFRNKNTISPYTRKSRDGEKKEEKKHSKAHLPPARDRTLSLEHHHWCASVIMQFNFSAFALVHSVLGRAVPRTGTDEGRRSGRNRVFVEKRALTNCPCICAVIRECDRVKDTGPCRYPCSTRSFPAARWKLVDLTTSGDVAGPPLGTRVH
ncbi:hypothetical protein GWI33_008192 [Rhynchophorus ferrugineus]|uniref:Uncharacterized protein n=1 Tax=Rhynchophorus ferrugineus TaxID=354439 RepID=A0A834ICX9_RHYFE|nr:hypothetical protein GWI33_008192 [Rhynchophorus ferrugineus]